ncbi:hypothetical protein RRG08_041133 [Elysia crispata]|uniref:Uncharacterized protein n=1 Tax=Elysia crispata TaxID=231223 RepID=A0AAE1CPL2_9GAST|nr:hypothetical protein RRG08_041133 [Elysia crispata]
MAHNVHSSKAAAIERFLSPFRSPTRRYSRDHGRCEACVGISSPAAHPPPDVSCVSPAAGDARYRKQGLISSQPINSYLSNCQARPSTVSSKPPSGYVSLELTSFAESPRDSSSLAFVWRVRSQMGRLRVKGFEKVFKAFGFGEHELHEVHIPVQRTGSDLLEVKRGYSDLNQNKVRAWRERAGKVVEDLRVGILRHDHRASEAKKRSVWSASPTGQESTWWTTSSSTCIVRPLVSDIFDSQALGRSALESPLTSKTGNIRAAAGMKHQELGCEWTPRQLVRSLQELRARMQASAMFVVWLSLSVIVGAEQLFIGLSNQINKFWLKQTFGCNVKSAGGEEEEETEEAPQHAPILRAPCSKHSKYTHLTLHIFPDLIMSLQLKRSSKYRKPKPRLLSAFVFRETFGNFVKPESPQEIKALP